MEANSSFSKFMLFCIMIGIWIIVLQNFGVFSPKSMNVKVVGGRIDTLSTGNIDVNSISSVNGRVDVNIKSINGYDNAFYGMPNEKHDAIHVYTGF